jgi:uncharacterized protein
VAGDRRELALAVGGGFVASLAAGLFGVGGGVLLVPLLVFGLRRPQHVAHATSLVAILFTAVSGTVRFAVDGAVLFPAAAVLAVGGITGAQFGARLLPRISELRLRRGFALLLLVIAARLLLGGPSAAAVTSAAPGFDAWRLAAYLGVGVAVGVLSSLLGLGGGVLLVPILALGFGLDQHTAEGTSLAVIAPTALAGAIAHQRRGYTDWALGSWLGATGLVGGSLGASVALGLSPELLTRLFGGLLATVAGLMLRPTPVRRRAPRRRGSRGR